MRSPYKTRDLARSLIAEEAEDCTTVLYARTATVRVYERLRKQLSAPTGVEGFQALASRALALAKAHTPELNAVKVIANGELIGLGDVASRADLSCKEKDEAGVTLIAQLLGLFLSLLGEATTLCLIEDLHHQVNIEEELLEVVAVDTTISEVGKPSVETAYEDLLLEINRLRSVSNHIEEMSRKYMDMEQGLISAVDNIRTIATVLDIFTLIRSNAGGPQDEIPNLQANPYMN